MSAELIARLEKADGPDRELDIEIGVAVGAADHSGPAYHRPFREWAKHYTDSIDAALTLFPEEKWPAYLKIERSPEFDNRWHVTYRRMLFGHASTPPIATCICALRARAVPEEGA